MLKSFFNFLKSFFRLKNEPAYVETNPYTINAGRLYKNGSPVRFVRTNKHSGKITGPRFAVLHYTANNSLNGTTSVFQNNNVSAHLVVDRDGTVIQMVNFDTVAWHAGKSQAVSKWGTPHVGLNKYSIGIEMVNYGYAGNHVPKSIDTTQWPVLAHENEHGKSRAWQPYPQAQVDAVKGIVKALQKAYTLPTEHILGHDEISPTRKVDPGPAFNIKNFRNTL